MSIIDDVFQPLYGKPCWQVQQGYGSFVTLEFGEPQLRIREPRKLPDELPESVRRNAARRFVYVRGDWHLWVHLCDWRISLQGQELANQASTRRVIKEAILELDGQALIQATVLDSLLSTFEFDLGGRLEIIPNPDKYRKDADLWLLYEPSGDVFSLRGDGQYTHHPGDTSPKDEVLHQFVSSI